MSKYRSVRGFTLTDELLNHLLNHSNFLVWYEVPEWAGQLQRLGYYKRLSANSLTLTEKGKRMLRHHGKIPY